MPHLPELHPNQNKTLLNGIFLSVFFFFILLLTYSETVSYYQVPFAGDLAVGLLGAVSDIHVSHGSADRGTHHDVCIVLVVASL